MSCPRRAPLVLDLRLVDLPSEDPILPKFLPALLQNLQNLQKLTIDGVREVGTNTACCDAVSCVQLPHLRVLRIFTRPDPDRFLNFLAAHVDHLEELETTFTYLFEEPPTVDRLALTKFPALRVLECTTLFLGGHERVPAPPNLTHLYRPAFRGSQLGRIAERLGAQLVSLRLGNRVQEDRETLPWTLRDVRTKFPRLRFLQVDISVSRDSGIPTDVVDWFSDATTRTGGPGTAIHPNTNTSTSPLPRSKITIAWDFLGLYTSRRDAKWHQFADKEATRVLKTSGHYVERVLHNLTRDSR